MRITPPPPIKGAPRCLIKGGHFSGKFHMPRYFTFAMARWKLCASTTFAILLLSPCTLCQQKSNISKDIQPIFEISASARRYQGRAFWVESFRCANILLLQWQGETLRIDNFEILLLSTCTLCQQKSYISKGIQPIFEIFASAKVKYLRTITMPTITMVELRQRFRKSVEYLWRYRIFAGTVYRLIVSKFQCFRYAKLWPCHCKSKIPAHLKLFTHMTSITIVDLMQRFRKSVEYLPGYKISAGTVHRLKVARFQILSMRKVFTFPLQK